MHKLSQNAIYHSLNACIPLFTSLVLIMFAPLHKGESLGCITSSKTEIKKQKGAHVFGKLTDSNLDQFSEQNIEWITLVAWGYQRHIHSAKLTHHNGDSTLIKSMNENWIKRIQRVRSSGYKVFVKPHVWIYQPEQGKWRSDIYIERDQDWETWKANYRDFVLRYARLAEVAQAEMFSIGTELTLLSTQKSQFWKSLIREIRQVYSGKLTYAANWYSEFERINFWGDLDFIGVQAYFPLVDHEYPTVQDISTGWSKYVPSLEAIHTTYNRPIIFTEMGYKSTSDTAIRPWEWIENQDKSTVTISNETQANSYQAFFDTIWQHDWFAGVHLWQYRSDFNPNKSNLSLDFTPQGKPAQAIIRKGFE